METLFQITRARSKARDSFAGSFCVQGIDGTTQEDFLEHVPGAAVSSHDETILCHNQCWRSHWRRGFTRQPESPNVNFKVPALQTPRKFNEKTPKRGKKKREMLGPTVGTPTHSGFPPLPDPPTLVGQIRSGQIRLKKLDKCGQIRLDKCGQTTLAKCGHGQIRFGQMLSRRGPKPRENGARRVGLPKGRNPKFRVVFPYPAPIFVLSVSLSGCLLVE